MDLTSFHSDQDDAHANSLHGRLLVVDDEKELLSGLCERLKKQGFNVQGYSSPLTALEVLSTEKFDLLLTDVMMPEMDGLSLLRAAREIDPQIACIMMTGQGTIQTAVAALKLGASDFVLKPFKTQVLLPVLTRALELRQLQLENLQLRETVAVHELWQAIRHTLDVPTLLDKIVDAALQQCEGDTATIMLSTPQQEGVEVAVVRGESGDPTASESIQVHGRIANWVAQHRKSFILQNLPPNPNNLPFELPSSIQSALSMPLMAGGKLVGVLTITSQHLQPWTSGQLKALDLLTGAGATAIESALLFQHLNQEEKKYRSVFENVADGIFRITPTGRFSLANPALVKILGYNSANELIHQIQDISQQLCVEPETWDTLRQQWEKQNAWHQVQHAFRRRDGSSWWLSLKVQAVRDANGTVAYYEGTAEDITERRRLEAMEAERNQLVRLTSEIGLALTRSANVQEMQLQCCEALTRHLDISLATFWIFHSAQNEWLLQTWISKKPKPTLDTQSLISICQHELDLIVSNRTSRLTNLVFAEETTPALHQNLQAFAGYPLFAGSRLVGVLALFSTELVSAASHESLGFLADNIKLAIEQRQAEHAIRETNDTLEALVEASPLAILAVDREWKIQMWNQAAVNLFGWNSEALSDQTPPVLQEEWVAELQKVGHELQSGQKVTSLDTQWQNRDGKQMHVSIAAAPLLDALENVRGFMCIIADISKRLLLEEQLRQSQKMDAIGRLAGGVAHDFNNLLSVINSCSELLLENTNIDNGDRNMIQQIKMAGDHAASLTRQLLAFSRKQVVQPVELNLNELVGNYQKMLSRLIREDVELHVSLQPNLPSILADYGQLEQVLLNLAINARDAMPQGGNLHIATYTYPPDAHHPHPPTKLPLHFYTVLKCTDNGIGMDEKTVQHIFEPFFTTKVTGTGLGLSTVFEIVTQCNGHIWVQSQPGSGTSFEIFIPAIEPAISSTSHKLQPQSNAITSRIVLLVEDDHQLRMLAKLILEKVGHQVITAGDGVEALEVLAQYKGNIDLLLSDVIMPRMNGMQLAE